MEITEQQFEKIMELAGLNNRSNVNSDDVTRALIKIEERLNSLNTYETPSQADIKVLVVDDLELSTYQLSVLLKKIKVSTVIVHNKEEAISEIKKQHFDFLFVDLFLPDEEDGLDVMRFASNYRLEENKTYKIVAISGTDDLDLVTDCFNAGVDEFVSKSSKWHEQIMKIIVDKNEPGLRKNFIRYDVNENTVTYNVKSLSKEEYVEELCKNATSVFLSGVKNIILNLEGLQTMPQEYAKVFTELYKKCNEADGKFIMLNPSAPVKDVLDDSCLTDVMTIVDSPEKAFAILNE